MMIPDEPKKRYTGQYPGQVVSVSDPSMLMRVKVKVFPVFQDIRDEDIPWAEYLFPVGVRPGNGVFVPAVVGDWVWVDFPYLGDSRRPKIVGGMHYCPGSIPNLPPDAMGQSYNHQRSSIEPAPSPPAYHDGSIVIDQNGVLLEIGSDGAIRATNKGSGSAIEICADGMITIHGASEVNISSYDETTIQASAINLMGPILSKSTIGGHGSVSLDADVEVIGNITVQGSITASGSIVDSGGNTNHHSHS